VDDAGRLERGPFGRWLLDDVIRGSYDINRRLGSVRFPAVHEVFHHSSTSYKENANGIARMVVVSATVRRPGDVGEQLGWNGSGG
jgi:hypothetical protein